MLGFGRWIKRKIHSNPRTLDTCMMKMKVMGIMNVHASSLSPSQQALQSDSHIEEGYGDKEITSWMDQVHLSSVC